MSSTFFYEFPSVNYTLDGISHRITNVNTAYTLITSKLTNQFLFQNYIIADYETPESIADKIYGDYSLYWTILVVNNIVNPFNDWVLAGIPFYNWMVARYINDPESIYGIHHFEDVNSGQIVDDYHDKLFRQLGAGNYPNNFSPKTNQEYEVEVNDKKRFIKLIDSKHIYDFITQFSKMINNINAL